MGMMYYDVLYNIIPAFPHHSHILSPFKRQIVVSSVKLKIQVAENFRESNLIARIYELAFPFSQFNDVFPPS